MVVDTNIFIEYLRSGNKQNTTFFRMLNHTPRLSVSTITIFELSMGATTPQKRNETSALIAGVDILLFDEIAADKAGQIYIELKKKSQLIEFRDILIAATAIVHQLPLATLNTKHFSRIKGLTLQPL